MSFDTKSNAAEKKQQQTNAAHTICDELTNSSYKTYQQIWSKAQPCQKNLQKLRRRTIKLVGFCFCMVFCLFNLNETSANARKCVFFPFSSAFANAPSILTSVCKETSILAVQFLYDVCFLCHFILSFSPRSELFNLSRLLRYDRLFRVSIRLCVAFGVILIELFSFIVHYVAISLCRYVCVCMSSLRFDNLVICVEFV